MTVKELVEAAPFCDTLEIVVREHGSGKWIQGYRIGKNVEIYPYECRAEIREGNIVGRVFSEIGKKKPPLKDGEEKDIFHSMNLKMKVIKKDVVHLPDNVAQLQVCSFQPRHIPGYHKEPMTHNDFKLDIRAYPEGWVPEKEQPKTKDNDGDQIPGQMNILDFME